jgi:RNA polymerase-binding protein DksA
MLPALPVEKISARGADMAGAAKGETPAPTSATRSSTTRSSTARSSTTGTKSKGKAAKPAAKPTAKSSGKPAGKPAAKKAAAKRGTSTRATSPRGTSPRATSPRGTAKRAATAARPKRSARPAARERPEEVAARAATLPVREGEDRWTGTELAEVRATLTARIAELEAEIAASASQIAEGDGADGAGDDQADTGAKTYEREHELSLTYNSRDLLVQTERAVQRIDAGTYGICESCGRPVGKARLQAFPRATLCVSCKQREERR